MGEYIVDSWTTPVWTVQVHLMQIFFFAVNIHYSTIRFVVDLTYRCETMDIECWL